MGEVTTTTSDNRPIRYEEDGKVYYRASSLGMCERAMLAAARGYEARPHPEWFQKVLDEGTEAEQAIIEMYQAQTGVTVIESRAQGTVELFIGEIEGREVYVRGHVDGVAVTDTGDVLVECKKFRPSTWPKFLSQGVECNNNYPWQVSVYMLAGGWETCHFVGGRYVDGSITQVQVVVLHAPPIPRKAILKKIARVERLVNSGFDVMDAGVECAETTYPCAYWYLHAGKPEVELVDLDPEVNVDLMGAIADYEIAKGEAGKWDREVKARREKLTRELEAAGVGPGMKVKAGDWRVNWTISERKAYEVKAGQVVKVEVKFDNGQDKEGVTGDKHG